jgi:hypothetical protein
VATANGTENVVVFLLELAAYYSSSYYYICAFRGQVMRVKHLYNSFFLTSPFKAVLTVFNAKRGRKKQQAEIFFFRRWCVLSPFNS